MSLDPVFKLDEPKCETQILCPSLSLEDNALIAQNGQGLIKWQNLTVMTEFLEEWTTEWLVK